MFDIAQLTAVGGGDADFYTMVVVRPRFAALL
jgi:hypothetical protein